MQKIHLVSHSGYIKNRLSYNFIKSMHGKLALAIFYVISVQSSLIQETINALSTVYFWRFDHIPSRGFTSHMSKPGIPTNRKGLQCLDQHKRPGHVHQVGYLCQMDGLMRNYSNSLHEIHWFRARIYVRYSTWLECCKRVPRWRIYGSSAPCESSKTRISIWTTIWQKIEHQERFLSFLSSSYPLWCTDISIPVWKLIMEWGYNTFF